MTSTMAHRECERLTLPDAITIARDGTDRAWVRGAMTRRPDLVLLGEVAAIPTERGGWWGRRIAVGTPGGRVGVASGWADS